MTLAAKVSKKYVALLWCQFRSNKKVAKTKEEIKVLTQHSYWLLQLIYVRF